MHIQTSRKKLYFSGMTLLIVSVVYLLLCEPEQNGLRRLGEVLVANYRLVVMMMSAIFVLAFVAAALRRRTRRIEHPVTASQYYRIFFEY